MILIKRINCHISRRTFFQWNIRKCNWFDCDNFSHHVPREFVPNLETQIDISNMPDKRFHKKKFMTRPSWYRCSIDYSMHWSAAAPALSLSRRLAPDKWRASYTWSDWRSAVVYASGQRDAAWFDARPSRDSCGVLTRNKIDTLPLTTLLLCPFFYEFVFKK